MKTAVTTETLARQLRDLGVAVRAASIQFKRLTRLLQEEMNDRLEDNVERMNKGIQYLTGGSNV